MAVFPELASSRRCGGKLPERSASDTMARAARSFTDPPGFIHSAFARIRTAGATSENRSGTSGVPPMSSTMSRGAPPTSGSLGPTGRAVSTSFVARPMAHRLQNKKPTAVSGATAGGLLTVV